MGLAWSRTTAALDFPDAGLKPDLEQQLAVISVDAPVGSWIVGGSLGGVIGGTLGVDAAEQDLATGFVASAHGARRLVDQDGAVPLVDLDLAFGVSRSPLDGGGSVMTTDLRVAATAGYTLLESLTPYARAAVFGGPVLWKGSSGGDTEVGQDPKKLQIGAGLAASLPFGLDLFVDYAPIGEKRIAAGLGMAL